MQTNETKQELIFIIKKIIFMYIYILSFKSNSDDTQHSHFLYSSLK